MCKECEAAYDKAVKRFDKANKVAKTMNRLLSLFDTEDFTVGGMGVLVLMERMDNLADRARTVAERCADKGYHADGYMMLENFRAMAGMAIQLLKICREHSGGSMEAEGRMIVDGTQQLFDQFEEWMGERAQEVEKWPLAVYGQDHVAPLWRD